MITKEQEYEHWAKCERYFANATLEESFRFAPFLLFLKGHKTPCRGGFNVRSLIDVIKHREMFEVGMIWFDNSVYKFSIL